MTGVKTGALPISRSRLQPWERNNFKILKEGDHVICAVSGKKIYLDHLTYWNVDLQEAYFSYKEAF